jgi:hypothetical protein
MFSYSIEDQQTEDYKKDINPLLDAIKSKRVDRDEIENQAESSYVINEQN